MIKIDLRFGRDSSFTAMAVNFCMEYSSSNVERNGKLTQIVTSTYLANLSMKNMYCPVDQSRLHQKIIRATSTHRCDVCHGVFIPGDFFREVKAQRALFTHRDGIENRLNINAPQRECPDQCTTMNALTVKGIDIDVCPHCDGIWLDNGELDRMILQYGFPKNNDLEKLNTNLATLDQPKQQQSRLDAVDVIDVIDLASDLFKLFD